jgi:hypothetical protein
MSSLAEEQEALQKQEETLDEYIQRETGPADIFASIKAMSTVSIFNSSGGIDQGKLNAYLDTLSSIVFDNPQLLAQYNTYSGPGLVNLSSIRTRAQYVNFLLTLGDYSTINTMYSYDSDPITQKGGQATGSMIDSDLADELFDVSYLLYSRKVPNAPDRLTINDETVIFTPGYTPRSVPSFGPMGGDISSLGGYQAMSTQAAADYEEAEKVVADYEEYYASANRAVSNLEAALGNKLREIRTLGIQSTFLIEEINRLNVKSAKESVDLLLAFNEQEKAAYEYRESYVREKRIEIQNEYEDEIRKELYRVSTQKGEEFGGKGDISSVIDFMEYAQLNTPTFNLLLSNFSNITGALGNFSNLYQSYDDRGGVLSNYSVESSNYFSNYTDFSAVFASSLIYPQWEILKTEVAEKYIGLETKRGQLNGYQSNVAVYTGQINTRKLVVDSNYRQYIPESNINIIEGQISSFLREGFETGYNTI